MVLNFNSALFVEPKVNLKAKYFECPPTLPRTGESQDLKSQTDQLMDEYPENPFFKVASGDVM